MIWLKIKPLISRSRGKAAEAPIGRQEISHKARHLKTCCYGDTTTPNLRHSFTAVSTYNTCRVCPVIYWEYCDTVSVPLLNRDCTVLLHYYCSVTAIVLTVKAGTSGWLNFVLKAWTRRRRSTSINNKSPEINRKSIQKQTKTKKQTKQTHCQRATRKLKILFVFRTILIVTVDSDSVR